MLYRIESTFGGFGDVSVEIFALPKACHSGSVGVKYLITDGVTFFVVAGYLQNKKEKKERKRGLWMSEIKG